MGIQMRFQKVKRRYICNVHLINKLQRLVKKQKFLKLNSVRYKSQKTCRFGFHIQNDNFNGHQHQENDLFMYKTVQNNRNILKFQQRQICHTVKHIYNAVCNFKYYARIYIIKIGAQMWKIYIKCSAFRPKSINLESI